MVPHDHYRCGAAAPAAPPPAISARPARTVALHVLQWPVLHYCCTRLLRGWVKKETVYPLFTVRLH